MGTLVALLVPEIPTIVSGLLGLFRSRHPDKTVPSDDEAVKALLAALSGSHDFGPLSAIAIEQLPQIREYILALLKKHQQPTAPVPTFTDDQLCDALEEAFKESRRKSNEVIDAWLAAHPAPSEGDIKAK